jgi:hypothetical protein
MSRKLIFATGMLSCFSCHLFSSPAAKNELRTAHSTVIMEEYLRSFIKMTPLEILATFLLELQIDKRTAVKLFSAYNAFLGLMNDTRKRQRLKNLQPDNIRGDAVFKEVRGYSHDFQDGLTDLFFRQNQELKKLTTFYGVF